MKTYTLNLINANLESQQKIVFGEKRTFQLKERREGCYNEFEVVLSESEIQNNAQIWQNFKNKSKLIYEQK